MDNELKYVVSGVTEKTGIDFAVFPFSGKGKKEYQTPEAQDGKTRVRFVFRGGEYLAELNGEGEPTRTYALLLKELLENYGSADITLGFNDYLKKILLGDCSKPQVQKFHVKFNVPDVACFALVINYPKDSGAEVLNVLESYSTNSLDTPIDTEDGNYVFVKFADALSDAEYQSTGEFAEYLSQSVFEELGVSIRIGVGTAAAHLTDLHASYQQALTALSMSRIFNSKGSIHSYKEYVLVKMLEDIPRSKLQEYLGILIGEDGQTILNDTDMMNTAEEFLESSLNVSETSRELFMHRNTLIYRLDKIEKATGLNIKNFSDAVTFRVITVLNKLLV